MSAALLSELKATTPATTSPVAPIAARTPPVESSSSPARRAMPARAITRAASMLGLSAFAAVAQCVAAHVGTQFRVVCIGPLLEVDEIAMPIVEGGVGKSERGADRAFDVLVGVGVARIGHRLLAEERHRRVVGVLAVDAEEGDALAVGGGELLQSGELEAARPTPRGPDVDDDRVA